MHVVRYAAILALGLPIASLAQSMPPWSNGMNNPAPEKDQILGAADVDNVPDLHGNPEGAALVLFVGGNQFFVMPALIRGFERNHPELRGRIFYETLPPGLLRKQMEEGGLLTLGNLTLRVKPDVYEAGAQTIDELVKTGAIDHATRYTTNNLEIMVAKGNPKGIKSLRDLARGDLRLSMPNPKMEGVARQIAESLRKAGGDALADTLYRAKVDDGSAYLTEIHHRQTPMRIMADKSDAGVVWSSEVRFQEQAGNPLEGVKIPAAENAVGTYSAGVVTGCAHRQAAEAWVAYLNSDEAQQAYAQFGFRPVTAHDARSK
ncbi:MAG TPA: substrate-binding domain-containing protein [Acidobacteriaceae bacterium]|nr:substrate-binding domain-containing protein [Acidobacteriaceae bacterium]